MTDARTEIPVDDDAAPIENAAAEAGAAENTAASLASDAAQVDATQDGGADSAAAGDRQPDPSQDGEARSAAADAAGDRQLDDDRASSAAADPAGDRRSDPAAREPVAGGQAQTVPPTAGSAPPEPSATPPLREPDEPALRLAEAAVFASATPMTPRVLSQILPDDLDAAAVIAALQARYAGRGLELCEIGGGLQFRTAADLAPQLRKVVQVPRRLPRVALETLAIVAYHQPITRPEIEDLRGTSLSQQTLDVLLENDLIVARGRKETPGRPTLWGTTAKFLEYFGLRDIRELPRRQDLLLEAVRPEAAAEAEQVASENTEP